MNILYIIGNGLDIAHHMKTSYQDFFKYYLEHKNNGRPLILAGFPRELTCATDFLRNIMAKTAKEL